MHNLTDACARLDENGNRENIVQDKSVISRKFKRTVHPSPRTAISPTLPKSRLNEYRISSTRGRERNQGIKRPTKYFFIFAAAVVYAGEIFLSKVSVEDLRIEK